MPLGAIGIYTFTDKLKVGLQQLMAGSRNFKVSTISRDDLMALTEEPPRSPASPTSWTPTAKRRTRSSTVDAVSLSSCG